ncbi:MAG: aspartate aminotransferase family protein [Thermoleophilia bacterium]|nr:aspartate aminotransferase family protein [Thermoleophilia bacterium]
MARTRSAKHVIDRGEGVWVFDEQGRRYFDGTSSLWYANVGHGRTEIAEAVYKQLSKLEAYSTFNDFANRPALELAERLADLAPVEDAKVFLVSGGGDGIDTAAKLARRSFAERGDPERRWLISRDNGYHGTHGFGTSLAGMVSVGEGYGDLLPDTSLVPHDSIEALEAELDRLGPRAAAFFLEPVIGAGGVIPPAPGYIEKAWQACQRAGALFIADAVICGFGRLGNWFGIERWDVLPDMVVFAKAVTSGYQPLGGVLVSGAVAEPFWRPGGPPFRHGPTYSGHPASCVAALANIDILVQEGLLEHSLELEQPLAEALSSLVDHPLIDHARGGTGLLGAIEFDRERIDAEPDTPWHAFTAIREHGVLIRPMVSALGFSPPLISTTSHIELVVDAVRKGLDDLL